MSFDFSSCYLEIANFIEGNDMQWMSDLRDVQESNDTVDREKMTMLNEFVFVY